MYCVAILVQDAHRVRAVATCSSFKTPVGFLPQPQQPVNMGPASTGINEPVMPDVPIQFGNVDHNSEVDNGPRSTGINEPVMPDVPIQLGNVDHNSEVHNGPHQVPTDAEHAAAPNADNAEEGGLGMPPPVPIPTQTPTTENNKSVCTTLEPFLRTTQCRASSWR